MRNAIERYEKEKVEVIPIILRPVYRKNSPLSQFQVLPQGEDPITKWKDQDEAFLNIVQGIHKALDFIASKRETDFP